MAPRKERLNRFFLWLLNNRLKNLSREARDELFEQLNTALSEPTKTIAVADLEISEVEKRFKVKRSRWPVIPQGPLVEVPSRLGWILSQIDYAAGTDNQSEPKSRSRLDCILCVAIAAEKRRHEPRLSPESVNNTLTGTAPKPLMLRYETKLVWPTKEKGEEITVQGRADYTLWYDRSEDLASNLAIIEAKKAGKLSDAESRVLGYMSMVHRMREMAKKENKAIFGITSDGNRFNFYKLDNESMWHSSVTYSWAEDSQFIMTYIRFIIRSTIHLRPFTSAATTYSNIPSVLEITRSSVEFMNVDSQGKTSR